MIFLIAIVFSLFVYPSESLYFPLSLWKNYHLDYSNLIFSHSVLPFTIQLLQRKTVDYQGKYYYSEQGMIIEFKGISQNCSVLSLKETIVISGLRDGQKIIISKGMKENEIYDLVFLKNSTAIEVQLEDFSEDKMIVSGNFDTLLFGKKQALQKQNMDARFDQTRLQCRRHLSSWLNKSFISQEHMVFAEEMLSQTISMLCKQKSHIGLCDLAHFGTKHARHEIDMRYSFLVLDLLYPEFSETVIFLFEHLINLFEDRLFYEEGHLPFVPIPEHLDSFRIYYEAAKKRGEEVNSLSVRVKAVLNGLINQFLLSDVNNLEQEINYRQSKNLHPTLYKMLTMKWKATSAKRAVSSIYEESFTPDYFYNYPNQTIDTCVSKIAWLARAAAEYVLLVKQIGDPLDQASLDQPNSLIHVLKTFLNNDAQAQQGRYFSINAIGGGVRVYAKQSGYQSLLPYIYGLTTIFPENEFKNITTKFGLASLNADHPKANIHYEYRGNIHSYFNLKLLSSANRVLENNKKNSSWSSHLQDINEVVAGIRSFILKEWQLNKRSYTMWTAEGKGVRNKRQLSILNVGFFRQK